MPDFFLRLDDGSCLVVDVKPAGLLDDPKVAEVLSWTGRLCAGKGWGYEVWSGADPILLRNIRFLGAGRRPGLVDEDVLVKVAGVARPGMTVGEAEEAAEVDRRDGRSAVLRLLWTGAWTTDLSQPLTARSVIGKLAAVTSEESSGWGRCSRLASASESGWTGKGGRLPS